MKTEEAIQLAGSAATLAKILNVTPSAVTQWRDGPLPDLRLVQLYAIRPEWFKGRPVPSVRRKVGKKRKPVTEGV
ncbi:Cro/CI family transcriptional regulator [Hydrogenophaga aquatica]|jgi:hypothetical protein